MMMTLNLKPALDHGLHHFRAQILIMIGWRNREIAFFVMRAVPQVILFAAGVPAAFFVIDVIEAGVLVLVEAHVIEDEELCFRTKEGGISQATVLQIHLGFFGNPTRIALVVLARDWIY